MASPQVVVSGTLSAVLSFGPHARGAFWAQGDGTVLSNLRGRCGTLYRQWHVICGR